MENEETVAEGDREKGNSEKEKESAGPPTDNSQSQITNQKSAERERCWSFPTVSRCPRCRGCNTRAVSTQKNVQYRKCMAPVCQKKYTVIGTRVAAKDSVDRKPRCGERQRGSDGRWRKEN